VLFVDNEPLVLEGLRRMLEPVRHEWQMGFVLGAKAGLEALEQTRYQVVVSEMRMPEMDGAAFLAQVRARHPSVARIMLTAKPDREAAIRSVGCAHRFLAKPTDPELLRHAIDRACQLREHMHNDGVAKVAASLGNLPSLPEIYSELTNELDSDTPTAKRIAAIVGKDIAMTAKMLQLVNSAFFGMPREVASIEQAVTLLGTETIRALVISNAAFTALTRRRAGVDLAPLWHHSMLVGSLARAIARSEKVANGVADEALQAGILHDIGKLVLATALPEEHEAACRLAAKKALPAHAAETEVFGCSHARIGAYVLGLWGLPDHIVETVAYHHDEEMPFGSSFSSLVAVHAADAIAHRHQHGPDSAAGQVNAALLEAAGCVQRFDHWRDKVAAELLHAKAS
jgi:putative nucleotidyltransferase with HDIG domain